MSSPYRICPEPELDDDGDEPARADGLTTLLLALGGLRVLVALLRHETCGTEVGLAAGLVAMALGDLVNRAFAPSRAANRARSIVSRPAAPRADRAVDSPRPAR